MLRNSPEWKREATHPPVNEAASLEKHSAVLLVARDVSLGESCRHTISDAGVDCVLSVSDSHRALELIGESEIFDAVVIGIGPGDVDAVKLAQHLSRHRPDTPTVVVSPIGNLQIPGALVANDGSRTSTSSVSERLRNLIRTAVDLHQSLRRNQ